MPRHTLKGRKQIQATDDRRAPDVPASLDHCPPLEERDEGSVEDEVAHAVDGVEGEGPGEEELDAALGSEGQGAHGRGERGALEVPAEEGRGEVRRAEDVDGAAEAGAREALPDGAAEPGLGLVVDLEMGGDGAVEALLGEDGIGVVGGELLCCYGPGKGEEVG